MYCILSTDCIAHVDLIKCILFMHKKNVCLSFTLQLKVANARRPSDELRAETRNPQQDVYIKRWFVRKVIGYCIMKTIGKMLRCCSAVK